MTDQQINEAVAEHCGYKPALPGAFKVKRWLDPAFEADDLGDGIVYSDQLPNYCNDLNAMAEAEKTLTDEQFQEYYERLYRAACATTPSSDMYIYKRAWISASARVRAEHFTRTIGKWNEESK